MEPPPKIASHQILLSRGTYEEALWQLGWKEGNLLPQVINSQRWPLGETGSRSMSKAISCNDGEQSLDRRRARMSQEMERKKKSACNSTGV